VLPRTKERRAAIYRRKISDGCGRRLTGCASLDALGRRMETSSTPTRLGAISLRVALVVIDVDRER